jgi:hypothetical protein
MLKFFRRIRQTLLSENKFSKYLPYAIGEIVLVVIGILIALQINNWNQERMEQKQKEILLNSLHNEFEENKNISRSFKEGAVKTVDSFKKLMALIGEPREELSKHNLDSLFFSSLSENELSFSENTLNSIIKSNQLSLFKNDDIQALMNEWVTLSEIRNNRIEKSDEWNNNHLIPFLMPYISFKEMDANGNFGWSGKSKVKPDYYPLFQKVEFENHIDNAIWYWESFLDRVEETDVLIAKIITASEPE